MAARTRFFLVRSHCTFDSCQLHHVPTEYVPSFRADQMPYGGTKESGIGREGLRFAMEDYSYERVMVLTGVDV